MGEDELKNFDKYLSDLSKAEANVCYKDYLKFEKNSKDKILKNLKVKKNSKINFQRLFLPIGMISVLSIVLILSLFFLQTPANQKNNLSELQNEILVIEKLLDSIDTQEQLELIEW